MHIPDGILPMEVCLAGYASATGLTWLSLRRIGRRADPEEGVPRASVLAAAFFVASWVHVPIPPSSVHLVLNGLLGVVLGWFAFPAILIGLVLQAVMFAHGGLTTLGVNATIIGAGALAGYLIFRAAAGARPKLAGFLGGASGILLSALLMSLLLVLTLPAQLDAEAERAAIGAMALAHLPLALVEGTITALVVGFLLRVRPSALARIRPDREIAG